MKFFDFAHFRLPLPCWPASRRALNSNTSAAHQDMLHRGKTLGLKLSERSERILATGLEQAEQYYATEQKKLAVKVAQQARGDTLIPVVYMHCE